MASTLDMSAKGPGLEIQQKLYLHPVKVPENLSQPNEEQKETK